MASLSPEKQERIEEAMRQLDRSMPELIVAVREIVSQDREEESFRAAMKPALAASYAFSKVLHYLNALRRADESRRSIGQQLQQALVQMPERTPTNAQRIAEIKVGTAFLSGEQEVCIHLMATSASQIARLLPYAAKGAGIEIPKEDLRTLRSFKTLRDHFEHLDERLPGGSREHWIVTEDTLDDLWRVSIGFQTDGEGRILLNNDIIDVTTRGREAIEAIVRTTYARMKTSLFHEARAYFEDHPDKIPSVIYFKMLTSADYDPLEFGP